MDLQLQGLSHGTFAVTHVPVENKEDVSQMLALVSSLVKMANTVNHSYPSNPLSYGEYAYKIPLPREREAWITFHDDCVGFRVFDQQSGLHFSEVPFEDIASDIPQIMSILKREADMICNVLSDRAERQLAPLIMDEALSETMFQTVKRVFGDQISAERMEKLHETMSHLRNDVVKHSYRVGERLAEFYEKNGSGSRVADEYRVAGYLHDIGKTALDDPLLYRNGMLTFEEAKYVSSHASVGGDLLDEIFPEQPEITAIARYHHKNLSELADLPPYLAGLVEKAAVIDVFDALTSERSYKPALRFEKACEIIRMNVEDGKIDRDAAEQVIAMEQEKLSCIRGENNLSKEEWYRDTLQIAKYSALSFDCQQAIFDTLDPTLIRALAANKSVPHHSLQTFFQDDRCTADIEKAIMDGAVLQIGQTNDRKIEQMK